MIYECDGCRKALRPGVSACPSCGEAFEEAVPADAEMPRRGFSAALPSGPVAPDLPAAPDTPAERKAKHLVRGGAYDWLDPPASSSPKPDEGGSPGIRVLGLLLLLGGLGLAGYYFLAFDTSVVTPTTTILGTTIGGDRVNNIGLMADRQNGILIGMGCAILGAILMYAGRKK